MKQINVAKFPSEDGKIELLCDSTTALGDLHDFLVSIRGDIVERMVKAQKEDEEQAKAHNEQSEKAE